MLTISPPRKTISQALLKSIKISSANRIRERNQRIGFLVLKTNPNDREKRIAKKIAAP